MKVLCSSTSGAGHWRPLVPIARALQRHGHQVVMACPESAADRVAAERLAVAPFSDTEGPSSDQARLWQRFAETGDMDFATQAVLLGFGYESPRAALPRLAATMRAFSPDLVVHDPGELACQVLAEQAGVATVAAMSGTVASFAAYGERLAEPVGRFRLGEGLDPVGSPFSTATVLTPMPREFDGGDLPGGRVVRHQLPLGSHSIREDVPPLVYATLGTEIAGSLPHAADLVHSIAVAVAELRVRCVLSTGTEFDLPTLPQAMTAVPFIDHAEVIPSARAVITHGGAGTVADALHVGRSLVVLPQFADQFDNGARVAACGVGQMLVGTPPEPEAIRDALADALAGRYDSAAARLAEQAAAQADLDEVVSLLEGVLQG